MAKKKKATTLPVRRGKDELDFLPSRAQSTPISATLARAHVVQVRGQFDSLENFEGRQLHETGTTLRTLYMRHGDVALGYRSFRAFLLGEFPKDPRRAYEAMVVAAAATARMASEQGGRWVLRAATWARLEGHADLSKAARLSLALGDERVPLLEATTRQIDEAIGRRAQVELPVPAGRQLLRARGRLNELARTDPAVVALGATVYLADGQMRVRTAVSGKDGLAAIKRVLEAVYGR